jgi:hypothetical protein
MGYSSSFKVSGGWRHLDAFGSLPAPTYHVSEGIECTYFSPENPSNTSTVSFSAGRFFGTALKKINLGTVTIAYEEWISRQVSARVPAEVVTIWDRIVYLGCTDLEVEIGDYIPELNGNVCAIGTQFSGYNLAVACPTYGQTSISTPPPSGPISVPSIAMNTHPSMSVWMDASSSVQHEYIESVGIIGNYVAVSHGRRYVPFSTSIETYTYRGNQISHVKFTIDPVVAGLVDENGDNPLLGAKVFARFSPNTQHKHGEALKLIVESSGMSTNAASYTAADSSFDARVSFSVVRDRESDKTSYLEVAEKICKSTLGNLSLNENQEVVYKLVENIDAATPDYTLTPLEFLDGQSSAIVEYQDIALSVRFENTQLKGLVNTNYRQYDPDAFVTMQENFYLYRTQKVAEFDHCLVKYTTARRNLIASYLSKPVIQYQFATASLTANAEIGDVVDLSAKWVVGESQNSKALVNSVTVGSDRTTIKCNALKGI